MAASDFLIFSFDWPSISSDLRYANYVKIRHFEIKLAIETAELKTRQGEALESMAE